MDSKLTPQTYKLLQNVYSYELYTIALNDSLKLLNYGNEEFLLCSQHLQNEQEYKGDIVNNLLACINDTLREPVINLVLLNIFYYLYLHRETFYIYNETFIKHLLKVKDGGKYQYIDYNIMKMIFDLVKGNYNKFKKDDSFTFINKIDF
jgi:hypothetical protein